MCSLKAHILDYKQSAAIYSDENVTMKPVIFVCELKWFFIESSRSQSAGISRYLKTIKKWGPLGGPKVDQAHPSGGTVPLDLSLAPVF